MNLAPYSIGIGDRFGHQGAAQLAALQAARQAGVDITPVWNKSNREHTLIGTTPADTRAAAMAAVRAAGWTGAWHLDADHISLKTVDGFLPHCDFYTLDVADAIGRPAAPEDAAAVRAALQPCVGRGFPALGRPEPVDSAALEAFLANYAGAVREAGRVYRRIEAARGRGQFITEVSTDEAVTPQTPLELLLILSGLAGEGVPVQTIAPKFTGRFNKGVDYVGDVAQFTREFGQDLLALQLAVQEFGLPPGLKISIHSGSDKFSLYGPVRQLLRRHGAGLHLKTAGTTWLEELIGLALAGGDGLAVARDVYALAHGRIDELCAPYATVIDIKRTALPAPGVVNAWSGEAFAAALRHEPGDPRFNPHLRQLLHVSFKIAAEMGDRYHHALAAAAPVVARCVEHNLYDRHLKALFL